MNSSKLLAQVGNYRITEDDVNQTLLSLGNRAQQYNSPQGRQAILDQLINKALMLTDAKKNLMEHDPAFKAQLEKVKEELLGNFYMEKILKDISVSEEEIKKYYEENPDLFMGGETIDADHILVDKEDAAKDILHRIESGEMDFAEAAKKFSTCPSAPEGGKLGRFGKGQMVPEFESVCFSMNDGEIKGPVKTNFGFHLIRVNKKYPSEKMTLSEVHDQLLESLTAQKQQKAYQSKMNQLRILYPVDQSGMLG